MIENILITRYQNWMSELDKRDDTRITHTPARVTIERYNK